MSKNQVNNIPTFRDKIKKELRTASQFFAALSTVSAILIAAILNSIFYPYHFIKKKIKKQSIKK